MNGSGSFEGVPEGFRPSGISPSQGSDANAPGATGTLHCVTGDQDHYLDDSELRAALRVRDVGVAYRLLIDRYGWSQRQLGEAVGMAQSEVSEILAGRRVQSISVLERIAAGLRVPSGWMGLAYDGPRHDPPADVEEVDEAVRRRRFLGAAALALIGDSVIGEAGALPVLTGERTGGLDKTDIPWILAMEDRLWSLDLAQGGGSAHAAARGAAEHVMGALDGTAAPSRDLLVAVSALCRIAAWTAFDAGDRPAFWRAQATALDVARRAEHGPSVTRVVEHGGRAELICGNHRQAAKLFELASVRRSPDAVGWGLLGLAYAPHAPDAARHALHRLHDADGADTTDAVSMIGHVSLEVGDHDTASAAYTRVVPHRHGRVAVQEMAPLAISHLQAGEVATGVRYAEKVIDLAGPIRSVQASDALARMGRVLSKVPDSTAQDLARQVVNA